MREGDLLGRRVLDVGCGTGIFAATLAERGARVWGIDDSAEMLALAAERGVRVKHARAEALSFEDGWFERATLRLVVHLLDRPRAFAELRRVLADDGRAVVATFDPSHFDRYWLNHLFPSLEPLDRARFPTAEELARELEGAGFALPRLVRLRQTGRLTRDSALERVRGRFISTLRLLDEAEFEAGLARAERELPERVDYVLEWLVAVAEPSKPAMSGV